MGIENPVHLLFIAAVALIVLGPKRLPELARSLGKGIRELRESIGDGAATGAPYVPVPPNVPATPEDATVIAPSPGPAAAAQVDPSEPAVAAQVDPPEPAAAAQVDPSEPAAAAQVDPPEPVRSGDHAPDRRSL
ncbi:MAG TPA: twin-arginine translocase TatA/TatE family subunit [Solirubrobacteraceae bacterium]